MPPREDLQFLAASPHRPELVDRLATAPARPSALVADLECSRASVHRHLSALADRGWVEKADGDYHLTPAGRYVHRTYEESTTALSCIDRYEPLLCALPAFDPPLDPALLAGGTLTVADSVTPHAPVDRYVTWLRERATDADRLRCVVPVLSGVFGDAHREALAAGTRTELLLSEALLDRARAVTPGQVRRDLGRPELDVRTLAEPPGFGLTVADQRAFLGAYDDAGRLQAVFESASDGFGAWATDVYATLDERADPVERPRAARADD